MSSNFAQPLTSDAKNIQDQSEESAESHQQSQLLEPKCKCLCRYWLPRRYCVVFMSFLGLFNVFAMRVNLSVAIEPMSCQFNWDEFTQGLILAAFFVGYVFGNVPGGWVCIYIPTHILPNTICNIQCTI